jgi:hypothetical protein
MPDASSASSNMKAGDSPSSACGCAFT